MDVENHIETTPEMNTAEQGVFFDLLKQQMPSWLLKASADDRRALYDSLKTSFRSRQALLEQLQALKSPEHFCAPLLTEAMSHKLGEPLDIAGAVFQHVRSTSSLLGLRRKLILPIGRDLLTAACENFERSETLPGHYHEFSLLYIPERVTGKANRLLAIKPHEFAILCRDLDLGKRYRNHIERFFGGGKQPAILLDASIACFRDRFEVDRHVAYLRGHISADVYRTLASVSAPSTGDKALEYKNLAMLGVTLRGPMFIGSVMASSGDTDCCVIYMPESPDHPLKEYASFLEFEIELSRRLKDAGFRKFFMRFVTLRDHLSFLKGIDVRLLNAGPLHLPFDTRYLPLGVMSPEGKAKTDLFLALFEHRAEQVRADARVLVVSTDDEDEKTRRERLETYQSLGINTLLFLASFVPVLGEFMCAVAGLQLLNEVYEGVESWAHGDQESATDYLFDTLENLILMATFSSGGAVAGKAYRQIRASSFVQRLRQVPIGWMSRRLWSPDVSALRMPESLLNRLPADERGLILHADNRFLKLGDHTYKVQPVSGSGLWEISHPQASARYRPQLETNGVGTWRHESETTQDWSPLTLFRRMGYRQEAIPDLRAFQILAASNVDESVMRQTIISRSRPVAILTDTARRFQADTEVGHFMASIASPLSAQQADADLQLYLLTSAGHWPRDIRIIVTDDQDIEVARYGDHNSARFVTVKQEALRKAAFYSPLLNALDGGELLLLLGEMTEDPDLQNTLLAEHIGELAPFERVALMERLYRRTDIIEQPNARTIRAAFANLPASVADELVLNADTGERQLLETGKVPLRLAEEARRYQQILRLNRAYEGLYLDAAFGRDVNMLILDTLAHLPGWPGDVYVEIRDWAMNGEQFASVGPKDSSYKVIIEAYADRYAGLDIQEKPVSGSLTRTRSAFFQVLWESFPGHIRQALGAETGGDGLRQKITDLALRRREELYAVLGIAVADPRYRSPMRLADRRIECSVRLTSDTDAVVRRSPVLVQRARELYPSFSSAQIDLFLASLDSDEVLATRALETLRDQYQTLVQALERWTHRNTHYQAGDGPRRQVPAHNKARATQAILRAWRRESVATTRDGNLSYRLTLDGSPLGEMPVLIGDFSHVDTLHINAVAAGSGLNSFLHNFPGLRMLSLTGNELTRIPSAIETMPGLTVLDLSDNRIRLIDQSMNALASLEHLQSLDLSFNPTLGRPPRLASLRRLRHLVLRDAGISEWPSDLEGLTALEFLDLRDNRIVDIPRSVFNAPERLNRGTSVDGNPLSTASLQAIAAYQQSRGINLGVLTSEYVSGQHPPEGTSADWVRGLPAVKVSQVREVWSALSADPLSRSFFETLLLLRETADYSRAPGPLTQRVWTVLEAACEDDRLRRTLFRMARTGQASVANAVEVFSDLEVRVLCSRAQADQAAGEPLESRLIRLLRSRFRLQEVQRHASMDIAHRTRAGTFTREQAMELSLLYRVRLAHRLELTAQPDALNVRLDVEVTDVQVDQVYRKVVMAERTSQLSEWMSGEEFWSDYLMTVHEDAFAAALERSAASMARLEQHNELPREVASRQVMAILDNLRNENRQVRLRLTSEALVRNPGLSLPEPGRFAGGER
ncbi:dermonecrotic toxin domain-containing protein [Pseudomonas sp. KCJK9016]|uniref:dermonecrotic toxin domain-containing protein n=1 Tax=Pseudomonas sp. KCJK9016 TaxID=3344556 RepID=UPI003906B953